MLSSRRVYFQLMLDALLHPMKSSLRTEFERHFRGTEPALGAGCPVGPGLRKRGCCPPVMDCPERARPTPGQGARSEAVVMDDPRKLV